MKMSSTSFNTLHFCKHLMSVVSDLLVEAHLKLLSRFLSGANMAVASLFYDFSGVNWTRNACQGLIAFSLSNNET